MLPRSPSSFTPFPDGRSLMLGPDKALTHQEVAKFSSRDADALPKYEAMLERIAMFIEPTLVATPPTPWSLRPADLVQLGRLGLGFLRLGKDAANALEILTGPARPILDRWFESEQLKVTLATDAVIGAWATLSMPGTAYVLFHHVMGECDGARGVWGYVRGGMGGISNAIASAAREPGAEILTGWPGAASSPAVARRRGSCLPTAPSSARRAWHRASMPARRSLAYSIRPSCPASSWTRSGPSITPAAVARSIWH